jgi:hypothetical protein
MRDAVAADAPKCALEVLNHRARRLDACAKLRVVVGAPHQLEEDVAPAFVGIFVLGHDSELVVRRERCSKANRKT